METTAEQAERLWNSKADLQKTDKIFRERAIVSLTTLAIEGNSPQIRGKAAECLEAIMPFLSINTDPSPLPGEVFHETA